MDTQTAERSPAPPVVRLSRRPGTVPLAVGVVLVLGVLVRLGTRSALWLDEALSVAIAQQPLADLPDALRRDGAPPLYYVLLHGWTALFGTGTAAVRALSQVAALAALPLAWLAGRRLGGRGAGWTAALLLATSPFAVRYANEARMYSLVVLLVLAGVLALDTALRDPRLRRLLPLALLSGSLALTHYWALFLLTVVGTGLLGAAALGRARGPALRCALALVAGGVLFLPWLPVFLFQVAHTGTPWAGAPGLDAVLDTWQRWSGPGLPGAALGLLLLGLALLAPVARRWR
ncbi:MAG: glycosyltransferase family 39 protein, partial [Actinomycetota bacterium]|nr:glycosyltransferase family 39 protein [Actinomycetota bacterium]